MTIRDHILTLPDGYRELALKYERPAWSAHHRSKLDFLSGAFVWVATVEGHKFWSEVNDFLNYGTPLPPLPNNKP